MREPAWWPECVAAMIAAVRVPVTVKCRIGVDEQDPETGPVHPRLTPARRRGGGLSSVHARKPWLQGSAPRRTADIPRSTMGHLSSASNASGSS
jgi:tRNA-dihydrouridine synthase A